MRYEAFPVSNPNVSHGNVESIDVDDYIYFDLPKSKDTWDTAYAYASQLKKEFKKMIVVGMGGSSLGAKMLCHFCKPFDSSVEFWDSVDPVFMSSKLDHIGDLNEVHWVFISKSGETLETLEILRSAKRLYEKEQYPYQFTVVTQPLQNALKRFSEKYGVKCLDHPINVGGRFSVCTFVGLIPLAFLLGDDFLKHYTTANAWEPSAELTKITSEFLISLEREEWAGVIWPYDEKLRYFGPWLQQLWSESLAKKIRLDGKPAKRVSCPMVLHGSKDQHSVLQQIVEGPADKFILFFEEEADSTKSSSLFEVMKSQTPKSLVGDVSILVIKYSSIWDLILSFQYCIIEIGENLGINIFDQPGVEKSKKIIKECVKKLKRV